MKKILSFLITLLFCSSCPKSAEIPSPQGFVEQYETEDSLTKPLSSAEIETLKQRAIDWYAKIFKINQKNFKPKDLNLEVKKRFPEIEKVYKTVDTPKKAEEFWKRFPCLLPYKKIFDDLRIEWFPETKTKSHWELPESICVIACAPGSSVIEIISAKISGAPLPTKVWPIRALIHTARAIHLKGEIDSGKLSIIASLHELVTNPPKPPEITNEDLQMIFRVLKEEKQ